MYKSLVRCSGNVSRLKFGSNKPKNHTPFRFSLQLALRFGTNQDTVGIQPRREQLPRLRVPQARARAGVNTPVTQKQRSNRIICMAGGALRNGVRRLCIVFSFRHTRQGPVGNLHHPAGRFVRLAFGESDQAREVGMPSNYQATVMRIVDVVGTERHLHGGLVLERHAFVLLEGIQLHVGRRAGHDCDLFPIGGQGDAVGKRDALGRDRGAQLARRKFEVNYGAQGHHSHRFEHWHKVLPW
jgi:hypothetical protein